MAYTTLSAGQIGHKAPVTVDLMQLLYDNPIAIANGDAGAPSVLPNIAANVTAGAVGSYVFARKSSAGNASFGDTSSGSNLNPTSAVWGADGGVLDLNFSIGSALSGTWTCMGRAIDEEDLEGGGGITFARGATLWVRTI